MRRHPSIIRLSESELATLQEWSRRGKAESRLVERSRIILLAHRGQTNQQIAQRLETRTARVSKWRQRFGARRLSGLTDAVRSGKPAKYDQTTEKRVLALLDEAPPKGYSQWNGNRLAEQLGDISKDQVWRILRRHDICLQRRRSWCISTDPEFGPKAADVVGLHLIHPRMRWCCRSTRDPRFKLWSGHRAICGYPMEKPSTVLATDTKRHGTTTLFAALEIT